VQRDKSGAERIINTLKEDQYFGELGILRDEARNATIRAKTGLEVIAVSGEAFKMLMESSKQTADEIARTAATRVKEASPTH
jgi:CRP-like cAMP-binding protein